MTFLTRSSLQQLKKPSSLSSVPSVGPPLSRKSWQRINCKRSTAIRLSLAVPRLHQLLNHRIHSVVITMLPTACQIRLLRRDYDSLVTEKLSQVPISRTTMHTTQRCNLASSSWRGPRRSAQTWCLASQVGNKLQQAHLPPHQRSTQSRWETKRKIWQIMQRTFSHPSTANSPKLALCPIINEECVVHRWTECVHK